MITLNSPSTNRHTNHIISILYWYLSKNCHICCITYCIHKHKQLLKFLMCIFKSFFVTWLVLWHFKWLKNMRPTFLFYLIICFHFPLCHEPFVPLYTRLSHEVEERQWENYSKKRLNCFFPYEYISNNGNLKYESSISYKHIDDYIFTFTDHEW